MSACLGVAQAACNIAALQRAAEHTPAALPAGGPGEPAELTARVAALAVVPAQGRRRALAGQRLWRIAGIPSTMPAPHCRILDRSN